MSERAVARQAEHRQAATDGQGRDQRLNARVPTELVAMCVDPGDLPDGVDSGELGAEIGPAGLAGLEGELHQA